MKFMVFAMNVNLRKMLTHVTIAENHVLMEYVKTVKLKTTIYMVVNGADAPPQTPIIF